MNQRSEGTSFPLQPHKKIQKGLATGIIKQKQFNFCKLQESHPPNLSEKGLQKHFNKQGRYKKTQTLTVFQKSEHDVWSVDLHSKSVEVNNFHCQDELKYLLSTMRIQLLLDIPMKICFKKSCETTLANVTSCLPIRRYLCTL